MTIGALACKSSKATVRPGSSSRALVVPKKGVTPLERPRSPVQLSVPKGRLKSGNLPGIASPPISGPHDTDEKSRCSPDEDNARQGKATFQPQMSNGNINQNQKSDGWRQWCKGRLKSAAVGGRKVQRAAHSHVATRQYDPISGWRAGWRVHSDKFHSKVLHFRWKQLVKRGAAGVASWISTGDLRLTKPSSDAELCATWASFGFSVLCHQRTERVSRWEVIWVARNPARFSRISKSPQPPHDTAISNRDPATQLRAILIAQRTLLLLQGLTVGRGSPASFTLFLCPLMFL